MCRSGGGVRVPPHSEDRPSLHKPKGDTLAAKLLEKQEQALIAQNAKALSDQLFEVDEQQHQQRTGNGKGVASTFHVKQIDKVTETNNKRAKTHAPPHSFVPDVVSPSSFLSPFQATHSPKIPQTRHLNQPGGAQACNRF